MSNTPGQKKHNQHQHSQSGSNPSDSTGVGASGTTGTSQATDLKSEAKHAVSNVSQRIKQGASEAMQEVRQQVKDQTQSAVRQQQSVIADRLESVCNVIHDTAERLREQNVPAVASLVDQAAEHIDSFSQYVRETEFNQMIDGAHQWIRRNPALFLGGAFVAGMVLARVIKGASSGMRSQSGVSQFGQGTSGSYGSRYGYQPSPSQSRFSQHASGQYGSSTFGQSEPLAGGLERTGSGSSPSWEES